MSLRKRAGNSRMLWLILALVLWLATAYGYGQVLAALPLWERVLYGAGYALLPSLFVVVFPWSMHKLLGDGAAGLGVSALSAFIGLFLTDGVRKLVVLPKLIEGGAMQNPAQFELLHLGLFGGAALVAVALFVGLTRPAMPRR